MNEWNDLDSEVDARRLEQGIGGDVESILSRTRIIGHTDKTEEKKMGKKEAEAAAAKAFDEWAEVERAKTRAKASESFVNDVASGTTTTNLRQQGTVRPHPGSTDGDHIIVGLDGYEEVIAEPDTTDGGGEVDEEFPKGLKDFQLLFWNATDEQWEPLELQIEISGSKIRLKAVGDTVDKVISEAEAEECE